MEQKLNESEKMQKDLSQRLSEKELQLESQKEQIEKMSTMMKKLQLQLSEQSDKLGKLENEWVLVQEKTTERVSDPMFKGPVQLKTRK